ncbi:endocuticle structural glycoprotein ABD-5-like [Anopheles albimanus]|nr:endocuticle structural glycoprotein ABD-5-like [Anopheles albimanus]
MVKSALLVLTLFVGALIAAPIDDGPEDLVRYENIQTSDGYRFSYLTKDGQEREETGRLDPVTGVMRVSGWYSYRTSNGDTYRVDFEADENGYRPKEAAAVTTAIQLVPRPVAAQGLKDTVLLSLVG